MIGYDKHVFVCANERPPGNARGCCKAKGAEEVLAAFKSLVGARALGGPLRAQRAGCLDYCAHGVAVVVYPEGVWYGGVTPGDVPEIVESHLIGGKPVERLRIAEGAPRG